MFSFVLIWTLLWTLVQPDPAKIDRESVVRRHSVKINQMDTMSSLTVGNGAFAFTVDATGLQTFPEHYARGVSLGTQAEWAWHSFPNTENYREEESLREYELEGKEITYMVQRKEPERNQGASNYFRINQHRLQMGNIGLEIMLSDGSRATPNDIRNIDQTLNMWTGKIVSRFTVEGVAVEVITYGSMTEDAVGASISSPLLSQDRLKIFFRFPYPTDQFLDHGVNYTNHDRHHTQILDRGSTDCRIVHRLDTTSYYLDASWDEAGSIAKTGDHYFVLDPGGKESFVFTAKFSSREGTSPVTLGEIRESSEQGWKNFWNSGGAVDFAGSTDPRAHELERRVILSQYLTRVQCAGSQPPQETGLTYNSWYGKSHLEMHWWHAAHYALWGRPELMEKSLDWYFSAAETARQIARRQGFEGVRWQKMTDIDGSEVPSSVGAFLIWQQPHLIYMAELLYRHEQDEDVLQKWKDLVFLTADFMASFPTYDAARDRYQLGKGVIPAQECFDPVETFNPPYELAYWNWALGIAQEWKERLDMERDLDWNKVLNKLSPLPEKDGVYLSAESIPDCYSESSQVKIDHPAVLAALSTLPAGDYVNLATMQRTFDVVEEVWDWSHTWGWDFPLVAMTATRLGEPDLALRGLLRDIITNTYLPNGHNYQSSRLTIYLPGNGATLAAVAMMCAGTDELSGENPGFPQDGTWKVRWEGLQPMP